MKVTLKAARVNAGLTQNEAAKRIGVSKETLANWERGKSFPGTLKIPMIEKAYNARYDDIIFLPKITL